MLIYTLPFSRLLKLELPQLAKGVIEIVEKHNPESLLIDNALNDFELLKPEIDRLIVRHGPHPITEQLEPLRKERLLYATAISFQVRGLAKGYIDADVEDSKVILAKTIVNRFLHNLRANNEVIINERVEQFINEIATSAEFAAAMNTLGFIPYISKLEAAHTDLIMLLNARNASISEREKGVSVPSSKAVRDGLRLLFLRITAAAHNNKELDYNPLISELNEKLIRYKSLINRREALLKSSKDPSSNKEDSVVLQKAVSPMHVAYQNGNDFDNHQDQKKTVAPSGKLVQLSSVNDEA